MCFDDLALPIEVELETCFVRDRAGASAYLNFLMTRGLGREWAMWSEDDHREFDEVIEELADFWRRETRRLVAALVSGPGN
ncbi:hypothetical protein ABZ319_04065 [Nocardia sp. NPDC005978]|uniref:hypothetical protein n=1 Tax=Nocardia sp. NPDC005978 TaxID=3156725 RepID=UPI0033BD8D44